MHIYEKTQREVEVWARRNFPNAVLVEPVAGMLEELGELAHAVLKKEQGIRQDEDHDAQIVDALGDIMIYLLHACCLWDISFVKEGTRLRSDMMVLIEEFTQLVNDKGSLFVLIQAPYWLSIMASYVEVPGGGEPFATAGWGLVKTLGIIAQRNNTTIEQCLNLTWPQVQKRDWTHETLKRSNQ
jgi:NTP pyrophosphatase (non-canonical NTP hydrolase)